MTELQSMLLLCCRDAPPRQTHINATSPSVWKSAGFGLLVGCLDDLLFSGSCHGLYFFLESRVRGDRRGEMVWWSRTYFAGGRSSCVLGSFRFFGNAPFLARLLNILQFSYSKTHSHVHSLFFIYDHAQDHDWINYCGTNEAQQKPPADTVQGHNELCHVL